MRDFETLYPGRFLKGKTLMAPKVIKIVDVVGEELGDDGEKKHKGVLRYVDADGVRGEIVWPKTNSILAAALFGAVDGTDPVRDIDKWPGRFITIHFDSKVRFGPEEVGGIRVYGSPHLKAPINVPVQLTRKRRPQTVTLHPTPIAKPGKRATDPATGETEPA